MSDTTAPTADNKTIRTSVNTPVQINLTGTGDALKCSVLGKPRNGTVTKSTDSNSVFYTPTTGFSGIDSFAYKATDGSGVDSDVATVSIMVNAPRTTLFWWREDQMSLGLWKGKRISEKDKGMPEIVPFIISWKITAKQLRMFQILLGSLATFFSILTATTVGFPSIDLYSKFFAFIAAAAIGLMTAFDLGAKSNNMMDAWRKLAFAVMKFNNDQNFKKEDVIKAWNEAEELIGDVTYQQTGGPIRRKELSSRREQEEKTDATPEEKKAQ